MSIDILKEKKEDLSSLREHGINNGQETYEMVMNVTEAVLQDYYEEFGMNLSFPIYIRGIVREYGIEVIETDLNTDIGFQIARHNGSLRYKQEDRIQIFLEASDSENTKRYVLAHEFSHFLMNASNEEKIAGCGDPMMPKKWEEQTADIMATSLLFPVKLVLKKMCSFVDRMKKRNRYPINSAEWLEELSESARVSSYYTIISYQHIKSFVCYLYNANDSDVREGKYSHLLK